MYETCMNYFVNITNQSCGRSLFRCFDLARFTFLSEIHQYPLKRQFDKKFLIFLAARRVRTNRCAPLPPRERPTPTTLFFIDGVNSSTLRVIENKRMSSTKKKDKDKTKKDRESKSIFKIFRKTKEGFLFDRTSETIPLVVSEPISWLRSHKGMHKMNSFSPHFLNKF